MLAEGDYVDGSWDLPILLEEWGIQKKVRVHGSLSVGGVMRKLVDQMNEELPKRNWCDYGLFWSDKKLWLLHSRVSIDQYGIQSDCQLRCLKIHNPVVIQLPDLQTREFSVSYAKSVFSLVGQITREMGIRHSEELSLARPFPLRPTRSGRTSSSALHSGGGVRRRVQSNTSRQYYTLNRPLSTSTPNSPSKFSLMSLNHHHLHHHQQQQHHQPPAPAVAPSLHYQHPHPHHYSHPPATDAGESRYVFGTVSRSMSKAPMQTTAASDLHSNHTLLNSHSVRHLNNNGGGASQNYLTLPTKQTPFGTLNGVHSQDSLYSMENNNSLETQFADSLPVSREEGFQNCGVPQLRNHLMRVRANGLWLDSTKSLMEQGIEPSSAHDSKPFLLLRFKYFAFYDLNSRLDPVRINQLFHQARWSILSEELEPTEEESIYLAALQYHVMHPTQAESQSSSLDKDKTSLMGTTGISMLMTPGGMLNRSYLEAQVDQLLDELQLSLDSSEGEALDKGLLVHSTAGGGDFSSMPRPAAPAPPLSSQHSRSNGEVLSDYIKVLRPGRIMSLGGYKKFWLVLTNGEIRCFRSAQNTTPLEIWPLHNCTVKHEAHPKKCVMSLSFGSSHRADVKLLFPDEVAFSRWLAVCHRAIKEAPHIPIGIGSKPKQITTLSPSATSNFLKKSTSISRKTASLTSIFSGNVDYKSDMLDSGVDWNDYVSSRYSRRLRGRHLLSTLEDSVARVSQMSQVEAKLAYIHAWETLPNFGVAYFLVRQRNEKRDEILGVSARRLLLHDSHSKVLKKSWLFSELKNWYVNWQIQEVVLSFHSETVTFRPIFSSCKILHEYIGGYICLALRNPQKNQNMDEATFRKFTCDMTIGDA